MRKLLYLLFVIVLSLGILAACKSDDKAKDKEKKDEPKTAKVEQKDGELLILNSLGFTTDELVTNWNEAQSKLEESGQYKLETINVSNGEFKQDISKGLILEGIVSEETQEVAKLSLIKKRDEAKDLTSSLDEFEDTIAAFFLLVAVTNQEQKVNEKDIGTLTKKLGLIRDNDNKLDGKAALNDVDYKIQENERGIVMTATKK